MGFCWSRSGTFAQIRSPIPRRCTPAAGVGREPSLRYAREARRRVILRAGVGREPSLRYAGEYGLVAEGLAGVGREPSLRYANGKTVPMARMLESVGNLRSDTLRLVLIRGHRSLESVGNLRSDTLLSLSVVAIDRWSRSGTFAQIRSLRVRRSPTTGWSRSGTFAQIRYEPRRLLHSSRWSRSGTFAQIRCSWSGNSKPSAGVGREPSLRYAAARRDSVRADAGVGREPSLRYASAARRPFGRWALESVGNLRSDTLCCAARASALGWSRSGTFAQIRSYQTRNKPIPAGVGREPSLRYALTCLRQSGPPAGVGREPSLRYAQDLDSLCGDVLESVGNLRSDTLTRRRSSRLRMLESVGNLRSDTLGAPRERSCRGWSRSGTFAQIR